MALPTAIYSTRQIRDLDAYAIRELGVPGYALMKRAGEASLRMLRTRWPMAHRIVIVCGSGNNAGDGYVLACSPQNDAGHHRKSGEVVGKKEGFWRKTERPPRGSVGLHLVDRRHPHPAHRHLGATM